MVMRMLRGFITAVLTIGFTAGLDCGIGGGVYVQAQEKPVICRIAEYGSESHPASFFAREYWAKLVEERTKGQIKCELHYSAVLGNPKTFHELVTSGACEAATIVFGYTSGRFPLAEVLNLPFIWPSGDVTNRVFYDLYAKGYFQKELGSFKILNLGTTSTYNIISRKPIRVPEDCKGLKLRSGGGPWTPTIEAWGAKPVSMGASEIYPALQRGVIDGIVLGSAPSYDFNLHEICKYVTIIDLGSYSICMGMNWEFYRKLPKGSQKVIDDLFDERAKDPRQGWVYDERNKIAHSEWPKQGVTLYTPTADEMKRWRVVSKPVIQKWIEETETKGLPGKKIVEDVIAFGKKYGADPY